MTEPETLCAMPHGVHQASPPWRNYYRCQGCACVVDWDTDAVTTSDDVVIKSIASRYCHRCIPAEAEASGLPVAQIVEHRLQQGRPV